jgi:hypothetical protein
MLSQFEVAVTVGRATSVSQGRSGAARHRTARTSCSLPMARLGAGDGCPLRAGFLATRSARRRGERGRYAAGVTTDECWVRQARQDYPDRGGFS